MRDKIFKYLLLFIICLGLKCTYVYAASSSYNFSYVTDYYGCGNSEDSSNGTAKLNEETCSGSASVNPGVYNQDIYINNKTSTTPTGGYAPYSIVVLIDYSGSMNQKKETQAKDALEAIAENSKTNPNSKIMVCSYASGANCGKWTNVKQVKDVNDIIPKYVSTCPKTDKYTCNWTFTQKGLNKAFKELEEDIKESNNAPMVIIMSDGYPSEFSTNESVISGRGDLPYLSYKYFYYTAKTLIKLKSNLQELAGEYSTNANSDPGNAKLITMTTIGDAKNSIDKDKNKYDELVDFGMNPSNDTYNELDKDINNYRSTEAATLKKWIDGDPVIPNDSVASVKKDDNKAIYRGVYSNDGSNGYINYYFNKMSNLKNWSDARPLLFHLPFNTGTGNTLKNVKDIKVIANGATYSCSKTKSPSSGNCGYSVVQDDGTHKWSFQIYRKGIFKNVKYLKNDNAQFTVRVRFSKNVTVKTIKRSDTIEYSKAPVDNYVVSNVDEISDALNDAYGKAVGKVEGEDGDSSNLDTVSLNKNVIGGICRETDEETYSYELDSGKVAYYCLPENLKIGNVLIENPNFYNSKTNDGFSDSQGQCVRIKENKVFIKYAVRESSTLKLGPFSKVSYAGGGFTIGNDGGASLENVVSWNYVAGDVDRSTIINFYGKGFYISGKTSDSEIKFISSSNGAPLQINTLNYASLDDVFYCDGTKTEYNRDDCTQITYNKQKIENNIQSKVLDNVNSTNADHILSDLKSRTLKALNSNDWTKGLDNIKLDVALDTKEEARKITSRFKLNVQKSCIVTSKLDSYPNGNVFYYEPNEDCPAGTIEIISRQYFVPVKIPNNYVYPESSEDKYYVTVEDYSDLSSYEGITIDYGGNKCPVNISSIGLYNCEEINSNLKCEANYYYRSIDISKPFPNDKKGTNWEKWYEITNNKARIANSFNHVYYTIKFNSNVSWDDNYLSWSNMNDNGDGTSKFITNVGVGDGYTVDTDNKDSFCPIGTFTADKCDKVGG